MSPAGRTPTAPGQIDVQLTMLAVLVGLAIALLIAVTAIVVLGLALRRRTAAPVVAVPDAGASTPDGPEATPEPADAAPWTGSFALFAVGDPGRAALEVVPKPDPRSWDRRETVLDGVRFSAGASVVCDLRAASVRGLSHASAGTVRQDEYAYRTSADGRFVIASLADGVSAGTFSEQAAIIVTRRGVDLIAHHLAQNGPDDIPWTRLLRQIAALVEERGRKMLNPPAGRILTTADIADELAATALFAVLDLRPEPEGFPVQLMTVGDTSAWILRERRWVAQHAVKNSGGAEVASSTTSALPLLPSRLEAPVLTWVRPGDALILMSDGIGDPLGAGDGDVGAFLADSWSRPPRTALEFAAHVGFARKSFDDDRTAVALWPAERPSP